MGESVKRGGCPNPDELRLMVQAGYRLKDIRDYFGGAATRTVYRWCEALGLPRPSHRMVPRVCMRCRQLKQAADFHRVNRPDRLECSECVADRDAGRGIDMPEATEEMLAVFWKNVERGDDDECWNWTGSVTKGGYGQFSIGDVNLRAHRFSFWLHREVQPGPMCVCHRCDNRRCVNPGHFYIGTVEENLADRDEKGRHSHGEKNHTAKLTAEQVTEIRQSDMDHNEAAKVYGVYPGTILQIRERRSWKHIA